MFYFPTPCVIPGDILYHIYNLLSAYKEITAHGPSYLHPHPEVIGQEEDHYKIEAILKT